MNKIVHSVSALALILLVSTPFSGYANELVEGDNLNAFALEQGKILMDAVNSDITFFPRKEKLESINVAEKTAVLDKLASKLKEAGKAAFQGETTDEQKNSYQEAKESFRSAIMQTFSIPPHVVTVGYFPGEGVAIVISSNDKEDVDRLGGKDWSAHYEGQQDGEEALAALFGVICLWYHPGKGVSLSHKEF